MKDSLLRDMENIKVIDVHEHLVPEEERIKRKNSPKVKFDIYHPGYPWIKENIAEIVGRRVERGYM